MKALEKYFVVVSLLIVGLVGLQASIAQASPAWVQTTSANPSSSQSAFFGIACGTTSFCVGVGFQVDSAGYDQTLIESSTNGGSTWSLVSSPNPGGSVQYNDLYGVSCLSATFCEAVGNAGNSR